MTDFDKTKILRELLEHGADYRLADDEFTRPMMQEASKTEGNPDGKSRQQIRSIVARLEAERAIEAIGIQLVDGHQQVVYRWTRKDE